MGPISRYFLFLFNANTRKWRDGDSLLNSAGLAHQKSFAEVATRLLRNLLGQLGGEEQTLLFTNSCQNTTDLTNGEMQSRCYLCDHTKVLNLLLSCYYYYYWDTSCPSCLFCAGQGNSNSQTSALDWPDDLWGGGRAQDETAGGHVLFHRPSQSMLGIFSESVHLC